MAIYWDWDESSHYVRICKGKRSKEARLCGKWTVNCWPLSSSLVSHLFPFIYLRVLFRIGAPATVGFPREIGKVINFMHLKPANRIITIWKRSVEVCLAKCWIRGKSNMHCYSRITAVNQTSAFININWKRNCHIHRKVSEFNQSEIHCLPNWHCYKIYWKNIAESNA